MNGAAGTDSGAAPPAAGQPPAASAGAGGVAVEMLRSRAELEALRAQWEAVDDRAGWALSGSAWGLAWLASAPSDIELRAVVVRRDGRVAAVAPLVRSRRRAGRYTLPGAELGEPLDFSYADSDAAQRLARAISALWLPLEIPRLPADAPTVAAFRHACRRSAAVVARPAPAAPAIDLDQTWEEPERKLTSRRRADLRRARRRAEAIGEVEAEVTAPTPPQFEGAFRQALAVEAASWKGRSGTALATDARAVRIFRGCLAAAATNGTLRVVWLRIGGRPAAMQLAVQSAGRFRLLKVGHDEQFNHCSPGHLLLLTSIRYAALAGLRSYELLGHPEPWTRVWTEHERPCVDLRVFPASASGIGALTADTASYLGTRMRAIRGRQAARPA